MTRPDGEPESKVWLTTSEAGVLNIHDRDPILGWGLVGPALVPYSVLTRYERAYDEFWAAAREVRSYFKED